MPLMVSLVSCAFLIVRPMGNVSLRFFQEIIGVGLDEVKTRVIQYVDVRKYNVIEVK